MWLQAHCFAGSPLEQLLPDHSVAGVAERNSSQRAVCSAHASGVGDMMEQQWSGLTSA